MNTLHASANAPFVPGSLRDLAAGRLAVGRAWTKNPAPAPMHEDRPLWSELLRFGLHGATLGTVTGLGIVVLNRVAQLL